MNSRSALGADRYRDRVAAFIRRAVMSGELRSGARIRELDLCARLKLSRTPVREAIQLLQLEGFLVSQDGRRGLWVSSLSTADVARTYDVTAALEGLAASLAAPRCAQRDLRTLVRFNAALRRCARSGVLDTYMATNFQFHETFHRLSGNPVLIAHLNQVKYRLYRYRMFAASFPGRMLESCEEHEAIIDAFRQRSPERAERAVKEHILKTKDLLVKHFSLSNSLLGTRF